MGANGCGWVWMGAMGYRGTVGHKNKASRDKHGHIGHCFWRYGRGNFPGHDVLWFLAKVVKYGCRWVIMDADGCNWAYYHGGEQKQGKKIPKWVSRACFATYAHSEKNRKSAADGYGAQRGSCGGI